MTIKEIDWSVTYDNSNRVATAMLHAPIGRRVTLWRGDAYIAAGEFTDAMVDERVAEVLGPDYKSGLDSLFAARGR